MFVCSSTSRLHEPHSFTTSRLHGFTASRLLGFTDFMGPTGPSAALFDNGGPQSPGRSKILDGLITPVSRASFDGIRCRDISDKKTRFSIKSLPCTGMRKFREKGHLLSLVVTPDQISSSFSASNRSIRAIPCVSRAAFVRLCPYPRWESWRPKTRHVGSLMLPLRRNAQ